MQVQLSRSKYITPFTFLMAICTLLFLGCQTERVDNSFTISYASKYEANAWSKLDSLMARIKVPEFPDSIYNVLDYGAKGDSVSNDLPALSEAISACAFNKGGTVYVPAGQYFLKGPIHFKSNVNLYLEEGARIFFSQNYKHYLPVVKVRWEGTVCYNYSPLIYGYQLENIAITGKGIIDGAAKEWSIEWRKLQKPDKKVLRQMGNDTIPEIERVFGNGFMDGDGDGKDDGFGDGQMHYLRPTLIEFYECKNILMSDFTIRDSPFWTVHPVFSKHITIRNLDVSGAVLNDDGIDPDSCEDVLIEGCTIKTHDDAISIKAGRDQDAWNRPPSRNIIVRNNTLLSGVNALCIGSEMSGGVQYMFAENNTIGHGKHALNFKCNLDRGGQVQNIFIRNTTIESCEEAMFIFRMDYHGYRGNNYPTKFNDFYVSNIICRQVDESIFKIIGVGSQPITRIFLSDIQVHKAGKVGDFKQTKDIVMNQVTVAGKEVLFENKYSNK